MTFFLFFSLTVLFFVSGVMMHDECGVYATQNLKRYWNTIVFDL